VKSIAYTYAVLISVVILFSGNAFGDVISDARAAKRENALNQYQKKAEVIPIAIKTEKIEVTAKAEEIPVVVTEKKPEITSEIIPAADPLKVKVVSREEFETETTPLKVDIVSKKELPTDMIDSENDADLKKSQASWSSFPEASVWTGAWYNPKHDTGGVWFNTKYLQWFSKNEKPENFGLGFNVRGDYGQNLKNGSSNWGYIALGPSAGYYRGLGLKNSFETDVSVLYRFDKNRGDNVMPAFHLEFSHVIDYKNKISFQADGSYFPNDSWIGPGIHWEHKLNKDWKVIAGAGLSVGLLDGDVITGFMPSLRVRWKNRINLGVNANLFTGLGTFYGVILAYELTPDITTLYESYKVGTVKLISKGETPGGPNGSNPSGITINDKTIAEMEKEDRR
jgi:hypothetical protein